MACHLIYLLCVALALKESAHRTRKPQNGFYLTNQPAVAVEVGVRTPLAAAEATGLGQILAEARIYPKSTRASADCGGHFEPGAITPSKCHHSLA